MYSDQERIARLNDIAEKLNRLGQAIDGLIQSDFMDLKDIRTPKYIEHQYTGVLVDLSKF